MANTRTIAIYNIWFDGIEILPFSIATIEDEVDEILLIYSNTSNFNQTVYYLDQLAGLGTPINWEPDPRKPASTNEINKRNFGLEQARQRGATHFIMLDCDEIYDTKEFAAEKERLRKFGLSGIVHPIKVYIKEPTLQCNDHTLVPGIHRMTPILKYELNNKTYPFTYDERGAHIDPTRRLNIKEAVSMSAYPMHHFSHVRRNIRQKIENSTARSNLTRSTLLQDYYNAAPGYASEFYRDVLIEVPNRFGITF